MTHLCGRAPGGGRAPQDGRYIDGCTVGGVETLPDAAVLARFGHALSDPTRARVLLALRGGAAYPSALADDLGVSRQALSNHLGCLRGCGLVVAAPEGRRVRYELADARLASALGDLVDVVLVADPACPPGPARTSATGAPAAGLVARSAGAP